jgi:hypothetical protein
MENLPQKKVLARQEERPEGKARQRLAYAPLNRQIG